MLQFTVDNQSNNFPVDNCSVRRNATIANYFLRRLALEWVYCLIGPGQKPLSTKEGSGWKALFHRYTPRSSTPSNSRRL